MKFLQKNGIAIFIGNVLGMTGFGFHDWRLYALIACAAVVILMRDFAIREEAQS